jgi:HupE / UreJ protein
MYNPMRSKRVNWIPDGIALLVGVLILLETQGVLAHGMSEADRQLILGGGLPSLVKVGTMHMLTGYDHLLFLFGVIFFLTRFKDILHLVTAFTAGHCITLLFATLSGFSVNYILVDAAIALTVCYKAIDNLDGFQKYLDIKPPNIIVTVFAFGLLHGLGLSTRLQELVKGADNLVPKILAFNVGVEIGQLMALSIIWIFLSRWQNTASFQKFSKLTNLLLLSAGFALFLFQMHNYVHLRGLVD